jgi:hypothetical protein
MIIDSSMKVAALINLKRSLLDNPARVHRRPTDRPCRARRLPRSTGLLISRRAQIVRVSAASRLRANLFGELRRITLICCRRINLRFKLHPRAKQAGQRRPQQRENFDHPA